MFSRMETNNTIQKNIVFLPTHYSYSNMKMVFLSIFGESRMETNRINISYLSIYAYINRKITILQINELY